MRHPRAIAVLVLGLVAATLPLSGENQQPAAGIQHGATRLSSRRHDSYKWLLRIFGRGGLGSARRGDYGDEVAPHAERVQDEGSGSVGRRPGRNESQLRHGIDDFDYISLPRHGDWFPFMPPSKTGGVGTEYEIHVPRSTRLAIHNRTGYVFVNGVAGRHRSQRQPRRHPADASRFRNLFDRRQNQIRGSDFRL